MLLVFLARTHEFLHICVGCMYVRFVYTLEVLDRGFLPQVSNRPFTNVGLGNRKRTLQAPPSAPSAAVTSAPHFFPPSKATP